MAANPAPAESAEAGPSSVAHPEAVEEQLRLKRRTLEAVLEQCQHALEMIRAADLAVPTEAVSCTPPPPQVEKAVEEAEAASPLSDGDYEIDELCDIIKSKVESPAFLEKLNNIRNSVHNSKAAVGDEATAWDIVNRAEAWEDKEGIIDESDDQDGYVLVKQEDIVDGVACYMAAYLLSLKETKELTPDKLQAALSKTFSVKKKRSKLQKAWDGTKVIYNLASWSATAIGIYQNPALVEAATAAFWTSCNVVSKLL